MSLILGERIGLLMFTGLPFLVLTLKLIQLGLENTPLVVQLLKGAYNLRPPLPRYSSTWDVSLVVSFIDGLGVNESLSLKDLSQKLGFLLALTAMERVV